VKVADVWREWGLQPWRAESFKFSTDPALDAKICDVIGLYLNPRTTPSPAPNGRGRVGGPDRSLTHGAERGPA
jgi:hypothetical protein